MSKNLSLINGKFKDSISVYDRGLAYGDGFFETMLWDSFKDKDKVNVNVGVNGVPPKKVVEKNKASGPLKAS